MSRREDIDNAIWSDPDFLDLTAEGKLTYIWSWTNPRCGMAGIYKMAPALAQLETGYDEETLTRALDEIAQARFAYHQDGVLFVRTRVKHMRQKTEQIAKSIRGDLAKIDPAHPLRQLWIEEHASAPWLVRFLGAGWEAQATLTGDSPEGQVFGPPGQIVRPSVEGQPTLPGNGNGTGTGNGPQGRGAGEGTNQDFFQLADELGVDRGYVTHLLSRYTAHKRRPTMAEMRRFLEDQQPAEAPA